MNDVCHYSMVLLANLYAWTGPSSCSFESNWIILVYFVLKKAYQLGLEVGHLFIKFATCGTGLLIYCPIVASYSSSFLVLFKARILRIYLKEILNFMVPNNFSSVNLQVNRMLLFSSCFLFFFLTVTQNVDVAHSGIKQENEHVKALAELSLWEPWDTSANQME